MIHLKRAYDKSSRKDGERILVERLWPRGVTKAQAALDLWLKDIAPSAALRKWFSHDPAKWERFKEKYWKELQGNLEPVAQLRCEIRKGDVTFIYAAHDVERNGAVALKEFLQRRKG